MSFANQVVIITGASSGLGWELARQLTTEGAKVGLLARRRDKLEELAGELRKAGGTAELEPADVTDRQQVLGAIGKLIERLGPPDVLVANSGVSIHTRVDPMNVDEIEQMIRVNLLGVIYAVDAVLPKMIERRRGHLVAVSSMAGYMGLPGHGGYSCSKAAVSNFMQSLRYQLRAYNIAVTTVCPGFVRTPMTTDITHAMPWLMDADRAVRLIVSALRKKKKVLNFPWQLRELMRWANRMPDWVVIRRSKKMGVLPIDPDKPEVHRVS